ncbi:MAG: glycoside hydrolase family 78 protein [Ardenticatenaceae bacterium]|nr:glycoside hydrolase family 78 protein [Ardenticatenaceae bacterium]
MEIKIQGLRCEYLNNPLGIDSPRPRLSWQLVSERANVAQSAYQIRVVHNEAEIWNTGKCLSDQSIHVPYDGPPLKSRQRCTWQVRIWDEQDRETAWSDLASWEMGLLDPADWQARWIEPEGEIDKEHFQPAPYLRHHFVLADRPVQSARIYATAHGVYELSLNGSVVGDQILAPGWTSYQHRLQYQVYDVTEQLHSDENAIGVILGDGWWRGEVGPESMRNVYGEKLGFLLQLVVTFADGEEQMVVTDKSWQTADGPIRQSDMREGETYDAGLEMIGWDTPGFDDSGWIPVREAPFPFDNLIAESAPPIRRKERLSPVEIMTTRTGQKVVDFGQNISGRVRFTLQGQAGQTVTLRHQEALEKDGTFHIEEGKKAPIMNIGLPLQMVQYTFKGGQPESYEPKFTTFGFRYALVEGYDGELRPQDFTAIAIYSDMAETGSFTCSNKKINQLHSNILWGQKGNFMDIPTDCPTRERAGWTGDAQVFARTGSTLMDTAAFFAKWLGDVAADQDQSGQVPGMVPSFYRAAGKSHLIFSGTDGSAGWGDAAIMIPWTLYQVFGDSRVLEVQYESMSAWFDYVNKRVQKINWHRWLNPTLWLNPAKRQRYRNLWDTKFHFGEWLEPGETMPAMLLGIMGSFVFSRPSVASAYYKHVCDLMAETAAVLGKEEESGRFRALSAAVKHAYAEELIGPDGVIKPDKQASYVRALYFDLVPADLRNNMVERLVRMIRENDTHLGTGFLSTGFLCQVLTDEGHLDLAYELLLQDTTPSWLYAIAKGATTIWESWETVLPDGSRGIGSHNHYSKGAIGEWLYRVVAGIEIGAPGYKEIIIRPRPGGGLTHAAATIQSMYGPIRSAWHIENNRFSLEVTIPPNTSAEIFLPDESGPQRVGSGSHHFTCSLS